MCATEHSGWQIGKLSKCSVGATLAAYQWHQGNPGTGMWPRQPKHHRWQVQPNSGDLMFCWGWAHRPPRGREVQSQTSTAPSWVPMKDPDSDKPSYVHRLLSRRLPRACDSPTAPPCSTSSVTQSVTQSVTHPPEVLKALLASGLGCCEVRHTAAWDPGDDGGKQHTIPARTTRQIQYHWSANSSLWSHLSSRGDINKLCFQVVERLQT